MNRLTVSKKTRLICIVAIIVAIAVLIPFAVIYGKDGLFGALGGKAWAEGKLGDMLPDGAGPDAAGPDGASPGGSDTGAAGQGGAGPGGAGPGRVIMDTADPNGAGPDGTSRGNGAANIDISREKRLTNAMVLYMDSPIALVRGQKMQVDPSSLEVAPLLMGNITMAPLRFVAENFGAEVEWDDKTHTAGVVVDGKVFRFTQGSDVYMTENGSCKLDAAVQAIKGRTFVPLDSLVEILGKKLFSSNGIIIISDPETSFDSTRDGELIKGLISGLKYLPIVGTRHKLMQLFEEAQNSRVHSGWYISGGGFDEGVQSMKSIELNGTAMIQKSPNRTLSAADAVIEMEKAESSAAGPSSLDADGGYSTTNVQVQGVDEADIVKTDGEYIYQVSRGRIAIARAYPAENMKVLDVIKFTEGNFVPLELYLHGDKLVVIGASRANIPYCREEDPAAKEEDPAAKEQNPGTKKQDSAVEEDSGITKIFPPPRHYAKQVVKVLIYDISNKEDARLMRQVELEGAYVSSRKVGPSLYLVANDYANYHRILDGSTNPTPSYRDTLINDSYINIGCDSIHYFPGIIGPNYLMIAGIDLEGREKANVYTYLGAGQNIYASPENLYVVVTNYRSRNIGDVMPMKDAAGNNTNIAEHKVKFVPMYEENTLVYKFALKDAKLDYVCKGEVPGTILNQFSMDEWGGYFRIATTKGDVWRTDERTSKNNLYILDEALSITGSVEDMAPGEKIYSVRFIGDRAYIVTFKTVDPLFVLDLKDPAKPSILGALKIPGYSDYLHPYDENHVIGFGKDTVEIKGQAYYQGMKVALFDITDVTNPVQKFSEIIGDRGTDSELLHDHKALLFSREKNLLAFPVTVMEVKNRAQDGQEGEKLPERELLQYGSFTFQGAYVYSLDIANGFKLKGRITHLSEEDYKKAGSGWYNSDKNVRRILYINDTLYTLSDSMIKANAMDDLAEKGSVTIP